MSYNLTLNSPDKLRARLQQSGFDAAKLEADDKLRIQDYYTATLGKTSRESYPNPVKVNEMILAWAKVIKWAEQNGPETHS